MLLLSQSNTVHFNNNLLPIGKESLMSSSLRRYRIIVKNLEEMYGSTKVCLDCGHRNDFGHYDSPVLMTGRSWQKEVSQMLIANSIDLEQLVEASALRPEPREPGLSSLSLKDGLLEGRCFGVPRLLDLVATILEVEIVECK